MKYYAQIAAKVSNIDATGFDANLAAPAGFLIVPSCMITVIKVGAGNFTTGPNTTKIRITMWGGGGGGAGTAITDGTHFQTGNGGSAGAKLVKVVAVTPSTAYAYVVGAKGAGGIGDNNGSDGHDTTLIIGATTYTAGKGLGGAKTGQIVVANDVVLVGTLGGVATNGDLNIGGMPCEGGYTVQASNRMFSKTGGSSDVGAGGMGVFINGTAVGNNAVGYAAGGSAAVAYNGKGAAQNGGDGADGLIIIEEFCT